MTSRPVAALVLFIPILLACPGRIDDPSIFLGPSGDAAVVTCSLAVHTVETQIIRSRCATAMCHERSMPAGRLDLESPGLGARLVGQASTCEGRLLVAPGDPEASYFLQKLGTTARCGARMPLGAPPLTASEIACVRLWIERLLADAAVPMDATNDALDVRDVLDADVLDVRDVLDADVLDVRDVLEADVLDVRDVATDTEDGFDGGMDTGEVPLDAGDASDAGGGDAMEVVDVPDVAPDVGGDAPGIDGDTPVDTLGDGGTDAMD